MASLLPRLVYAGFNIENSLSVIGICTIIPEDNLVFPGRVDIIFVDILTKIGETIRGTPLVNRIWR